jgi:hypothetical protein
VQHAPTVSVIDSWVLERRITVFSSINNILFSWHATLSGATQHQLGDLNQMVAEGKTALEVANTLLISSCWYEDLEGFIRVKQKNGTLRGVLFLGKMRIKFCYFLDLELGKNRNELTVEFGGETVTLRWVA